MIDTFDLIWLKSKWEIAEIWIWTMLVNYYLSADKMNRTIDVKELIPAATKNLFFKKNL